MDEKIKKAVYVVGGIIALWIIVQVLFVVFLDCVGCNPIERSPSEIASYLLADIDTSEKIEKVSKRVDFAKEDSINCESLSSYTGLAKNQICLDISGKLKEKNFELKNNSMITFSGKHPIRAKLAGICAPKEDFLEADFLNDFAPILLSKEFDFTESGCADTCIDEQKCCVLFLYESDE